MLVAVAIPKTRMVNVRLTERVHKDFKTACELRGVSMSSLMHQFVVRTIREEREMDPKAFERADLTQGIAVAPRSKSGGIKLMKERDNAHAPKKKSKRVA